jgi:hypothetical protein
MMKRLILILTAVALLGCVAPGLRAAAQQGKAPALGQEVLPDEIQFREDYTIVVNGRVIIPDVPPVERDGVIFVPLRFVSEAMGAKVSWNDQTLQAVLEWDGARTVFTIGKLEVDYKGKPVLLSKAPFIYSERTMLPLKISAQGIGYEVYEQPNVMVMTRPDDAATPAHTAQADGKGKVEKGALKGMAGIKEKARKDPITKSLKPFVLIAWALTGILWILRMIGAMSGGAPDRFKDKIVIAIFLAAGVPLVLLTMFSTYWAAMVLIGTCVVGLVSTETYEDKIVTMANTAQGMGLICTLFGLGLLIGPAIAERDIAAIGYGIYVKIEPTITGLSLSILLNMLFGYEARKRIISQRG